MDQVTPWQELLTMVAQVAIGDRNSSKSGGGSVPPIPKSKLPIMFPKKISWYIMTLNVLIGIQIFFYLSLWEERRKWEMANGVTRRYLLDIMYGTRPDRQPLIRIPDFGLPW